MCAVPVSRRAVVYGTISFSSDPPLAWLITSRFESSDSTPTTVNVWPLTSSVRFSGSTPKNSFFASAPSTMHTRVCASMSSLLSARPRLTSPSFIRK